MSVKSLQQSFNRRGSGMAGIVQNSDGNQLSFVGNQTANLAA
jgi:hypothetical protein